MLYNVCDATKTAMVTPPIVNFRLQKGGGKEKRKTHCVMKPSCGWISAVDSIQKITMVKNIDRRKNPQDVQGLTLYLSQITTLYLGLCCITNIVQHSVFVEFNRMLAAILRSVRGARVETHRLEFSFLGRRDTAT